MATGAFKVTTSLEEKKVDCDLLEQASENVPEYQLVLCDDVSRILTVLSMLFDKDADAGRFSDYFKRLESIARHGLEGQNAKPDVSNRALADFQSQVTTREAGSVKHRYMKRLVLYAGIPAALCLITAFILLALQTLQIAKDDTPIIKLTTLANFFLLLSGCATGVWLSFGARRQTLTFYELHMPEPDQLHPAMCVAFVGTLTVIVSVFFHLKIITLGIGDFATSSVYLK